MILPGAEIFLNVKTRCEHDVSFVKFVLTNLQFSIRLLLWNLSCINALDLIEGKFNGYSWAWGPAACALQNSWALVNIVYEKLPMESWICDSLLQAV